MPIFQTINKTKVPIHIWTNNIENEALKQAIAIADNLPVYSHVALMPDVHCGAGMPIGGVAALENAISPMAVGSDIGCGMISVKTDIKEIETNVLKGIFSEIRNRIPVGFNHHKNLDWMDEDLKNYFKNAPIEIPIIKKEIEAAKYQMNTLGGGNHFIEFQQDRAGYIWFTVHTGSRNIGYKIAEHYHNLALENGISTLKALPYFEIDGELGQEYLKAMRFAQDFAYENRYQIACTINDILISIIGPYFVDNSINIHHNYAMPLTDSKGWKDYLVLHRKGATSAKLNEMGIIPGSQGSNTYIVRGKGNKDSFQSCSHGAGRVMSRTKAKKSISAEDATNAMGGLICDFSRGGIDEAPQAYKDIEEVMANQTDLVDIIYTLKPYKIAAIKG